jgi:Ser/Thr protein kinase RdoA (MazF antagonist)
LWQSPLLYIPRMQPTWDLRRPLRSRADTGDPPDSATVAQLVADHWGAIDVAVDPDGAIHPRHRMVRVDGVQAFLRVDPGWEGPHPAKHSVRLVHHLAQRGAPVPRIRLLRPRVLSLAWNDYTISMETVLPGSSPSARDLSVLPAAGENLGRIHQSILDFEPPRSSRPVHAYVRPILQLAAQREALTVREPFEALSAHIEANCADVLETDIAWLFCHGDVGCGNVIEDRGHVGYTDFGRAAYLPALVDLLMPRFRWLMGDTECDRGFLTVSEAAAFIRGYERVRPLTDKDRAAIPPIWAAYYAEYLSFLWVKWGEARDRGRHGLFEICRRINNLVEEALEMGQELVRELDQIRR